jgi:hypothetical protein
MFYIAQHIKIMMDVFGLEYKEIIYNITNYKRGIILKDMVRWYILPFQMHKFYSEFDISNINTWLNLSFDYAINLIENMKKIK